MSSIRRSRGGTRSLILNPGEAVREGQRKTSGNLGHDDMEHEVIDAQGQILGTIIYTASTSLKPPFIARHCLLQSGNDGKVIVDVRW